MPDSRNRTLHTYNQNCHIKVKHLCLADQQPPSSMRFSSFLLAVFFSVVAADDGPTINCGSTALSSVISDSDFSKLKVAESILPGMHDTLCGGPNPVANDICSNEFVCTMTAGLHPLTKSNLVQIVYNMTIDPVAPGQPFQGSDSSKCGTVMVNQALGGILFCKLIGQCY